jgi:DNA-binding Xre family transcriptional regulator
MIILDVTRILKKRGVTHMRSYLVKQGFSAYAADLLSKKKPRVIKLDLLEQLCVMLHCSPMDLLEYIPDDKYNVPKNHPLYSFKKTDSEVDITAKLKTLPMTEIQELEEFLKKKEEEREKG